MGEALAQMFAAGRRDRRALFMPFLTAGLPDPAASPALFGALADGGADAFEVGLPYSDPLMDGPVIQAASARALAAGTDLEASLGVVAAAAELKPVIAMTYVNPIERAGPADFCRRLAAAGALGLIVADLPLEEAGPFLEAAGSAGLGMALFAAPTTDDARLRRVVAAGPAFIYGVADLGVTGERRTSSGRAQELARRVRAVTTLPLVLGVGISTPEQAAAAAPLADGVIVGSALVRLVLDSGDTRTAAAALRQAAAAYVAALAGPP